VLCKKTIISEKIPGESTLKILSLAASNYRTLEEITINFNKNYCAISGKNNAGKSNIIRLLLHLLHPEPVRPWMRDEQQIEYKDDKTQWVKNDEDIEVTYEFCLSKNDDHELITFVEKISEIEIREDKINLTVQLTCTSSSKKKYIVSINGNKSSEQSSKEIIQKLQSSNIIFLHNSTSHDELYYAGRNRSFYEIILSEEERQALTNASKTVSNKLKKVAKEHKQDLNKMIGRLADKYDVEFTTFDSNFSRTIPLSINLKDKRVTIPLNEWGSGTQNRTYILMSVLQANRIKEQGESGEGITPIVVIEEPESFLHPSAQAEFGKILRELSEELGIQIITTTHSPYMLNQEKSSANILLSRKLYRGKLQSTISINSSEDNWMKPFAEHLGLNSKEFENWKPLFATQTSRVLLVEGEIDKQYFEFIRANNLGTNPLNEGIEVVPYGGKDTLKNNLLLKFVLSKFDKVFVTFDLDASNEVSTTLARVGLKKDRDFRHIGINKPGKDNIEGLLPPKIHAKVLG